MQALRRRRERGRGLGAEALAPEGVGAAQRPVWLFRVCSVSCRHLHFFETISRLRVNGLGHREVTGIAPSHRAGEMNIAVRIEYSFIYKHYVISP